MKRRRIWLCLTLLLLVALFMLPAVHWRLIGFVKGEAFYQGRPTSWWSGELRQWGPAYHITIGGPGRIWAHRIMWHRQSTWLEELGDKVLSSTPASHPPLIAAPDPASVPVLVQLLADQDSDVRFIATHALGKIGPDAHAAVPALVHFIQEAELRFASATQPGDFIRWSLDNAALLEETERALKLVNPDAAAKVGVK